VVVVVVVVLVGVVDSTVEVVLVGVVNDIALVVEICDEDISDFEALPAVLAIVTLFIPLLFVRLFKVIVESIGWTVDC
jgi:hypothetical protein